MVTPAIARPDGAPRPTIEDIARAAGVSIAVVSYALNGKPGVSPATRERIVRIADEFGWRPHAAARSMRGGSHTVALAVGTGLESLARAETFLDFVAAAQDALEAAGFTLAVHVLPDDAAAALRRWWQERRCDVVVLADPVLDDARVAALRRGRVPAVVLGHGEADDVVSHVAFDHGAAGMRVAEYLRGLGHRRVAAVTGPQRLLRVQAQVAALGVALGDGHGGGLQHVATDASPEQAAAAARSLLTAGERPTALVFDSGPAALAGLDVTRRLELQVPWDVSILTLADSALGRLSTPAVTTLLPPLDGLAAAAARAVLAMLAGHRGVVELVDAGGLAGHRGVVELVDAGGLAVRGSTGPPR